MGTSGGMASLRWGQLLFKAFYLASVCLAGCPSLVEFWSRAGDGDRVLLGWLWTCRLHVTGGQGSGGPAVAAGEQVK